MTAHRDHPDFGKKFTKVCWTYDPDEPFVERLTASEITNGQVFQGDAQVILDRIPFESVDLVFTSPPYNTGKKDLYDVYIDALNDQEYLTFLYTVIQKCEVVLKPGGHLIIVMPPGIGRKRYKPYASLLIAKLENDPILIHRGIKHWFKGHSGGKPTATGSIGNKPSINDDIEWLIIYRKGEEDRNGKKGEQVTPEFYRDMNTSWFIKPETNPKKRLGHNAVMPIKLAEKVIKYWTRPGEVVLDPFAGTGTTLYAAMKWSRKAWGIEISAQYCKIIRKRLQHIPRPLDQFLDVLNEKKGV